MLESQAHPRNESRRTSAPISDATAERFWDKVRDGPSHSCWQWDAYTDRDGYGRFSIKGRKRRAHRVAVRLDGRDPSGKVVRHTCDNPNCVNPRHLQVGTQRENMKDMVRRDRQPRGAQNGQAKLTREAVLDIRESDQPSRVLAAEYGVSPSHIRMIKTGRAWGHLP